MRPISEARAALRPNALPAAAYAALIIIALTATGHGAAILVERMTAEIETAIGEAPLRRPPLTVATVTSPKAPAEPAAVTAAAAPERPPAIAPPRLATGQSDPADRFYRGSGATYRTVCVRLCDGYFWTISFSTTEDHFDVDRATCERSCGQPARLFFYKVPGGRPEDMEDQAGRSYARLKTAFLFRTRYDAACRCTPDPWSREAGLRHKLYALADAARRGDANSRIEHDRLKADLTSLSPTTAVAALPDIDLPPPKRTLSGPAAPRRLAEARPPGEMRLGASPARGAMPAPGAGNRFRDWRVRAFEGQ
jgi:hypothetical protein